MNALIDSIVFLLKSPNFDSDAKEKYIKEKLKTNLSVRQDYSDTKIYFEDCIQLILKSIQLEYPCIDLYIPMACTRVPENRIDYMLQETTEKILRMNRLLHLFEPSTNKIMIKLCGYVVKNIDYEINMDIVSEYLFLNKKYLSTLIKKNLGMKFTEYLRKLKIERAKKLLSDTDLAVYEIAERLHYKDVEYFSRIFKSETGSTPSNYLWYPNDDLNSKIHALSELPDEIVIGVIGAYSGEYAYMEKGKKLIYQYAADEINQHGGVQGKKIQMVYEDYHSNLSEVESKTQDLIHAGVNVIMGGFLSSAREIIRPIIDKNHMLYFYDSLYEGGLADHYTFCTSSMPEQNLFPVLQYMLQNNRKQFYILATDYNYGILSCECAKQFICDHSGEVVGLEYVPNHKTNFAVTIENIRELSPDVIVTFLVGEKQSLFFEQWHKVGNCNIAMITTSAIPQAYMHLTNEKGIMENVYFSAPYSENLDSVQAMGWKEKIRNQYGPDKIPYLGSDHEAAYISMWLYKTAVDMCGSTNVEQLIHTLENGNITLDMPAGLATVNPRDHHLIRDVGIFRIDENNQIQTLQIITSVKSDFVENVLSESFHVKEGLKQLGKKSPNIQYNMMLYKL